MKFEDKNYWKSLINMAVIKFLILHCLRQSPTHGYDLLNKVNEFTSGCCSPTYGSIYPILKEFCDEGYAVIKEERVNNRQRKVYYLTSRGQNAYYQAVDAWEDILPYLNKISDEITLEKERKR